jgi:hypothetical protein
LAASVGNAPQVPGAAGEARSAAAIVEESVVAGAAAEQPVRTRAPMPRMTEPPGESRGKEVVFMVDLLAE